MLDIYHYQDILIKLGLAVLFGGLIGFERELKNKSAGLRTNILICVGACLVMMISEDLARKVSLDLLEATQGNPVLAKIAGDPGRLAAQVVSGIGFLGAGAILQSQGKGIVLGMTTAATIWTNAAIGLAIGSGYYFLAFCSTLVTLATLFLIQLLRFLPIANRPRLRRLIIIFKRHRQVDDLKRYFVQNKIGVETEEFKKRIDDFEYRAELLISPNRENSLTADFSNDKDIISFHMAESL